MEKNVNKNYVRQIIAVGETLIKNAESIAGTESNVTTIDIDVRLEPNSLPNINISKSILPERAEGLTLGFIKKHFNIPEQEGKEDVNDGKQ